MPIIASWDFSTAFPPLSQEFMFEAIKQLGFPRGILNFIGGIYETVLALGSTGAVMFVISSGVLR